jgi:hypothetical protein
VSMENELSKNEAVMEAITKIWKMSSICSTLSLCSSAIRTLRCHVVKCFPCYEAKIGR